MKVLRRERKTILKSRRKKRTGCRGLNVQGGNFMGRTRKETLELPLEPEKGDSEG